MPCANPTQGRAVNLPLTWLRMLFPKSIFWFASVIAAKCGWEFSSGWCSQQVLTSCGVLFFSGSLAIWLSATGKPKWSPDGTPNSCRAIITVPSPCEWLWARRLPEPGLQGDKWRHLKDWSRNWATGFIKTTAGAAGDSGGCANC